MRTESDVLTEWIDRGYIAQEDETLNGPKYLSFIRQSKEAILAYCNIPIRANLPDGLFYPWVEISWGTSQGTISVQGTGEIKSVSEGDTTVTFDVGTTTVKSGAVAVDYTAALNRFRRLP